MCPFLFLFGGVGDFEGWRWGLGGQWDEGLRGWGEDECGRREGRWGKMWEDEVKANVDNQAAVVFFASSWSKELLLPP